MSHPPLVLVHGLWNSPRLFNRLIAQLAGQRDPLLIPHLTHGLGQVPLRDLTSQLDQQIQQSFGPHEPIDLLGFSMGGLIARAWIHWHGGHRRTRRIDCVGSPQRGTLTAQLVPRAILAGIADMKIGSQLIKDLAAEHQHKPEILGSIDCRSYFCSTDLMVIPSWRGVLPVGKVRRLPSFGHLGLIRHPRCVAALAQTLLQ
ncbi:MAG: esterase/lipase family protein [Prochlorococcaceae cyanobacterium]|jgi:triacylglycerol lipase